MSYKEIREDKEIAELIKKGDEILGALGYTDHSQEHCLLVAEHASDILKQLGYKKKEIELVKIAAYMHDIGNAINRNQHAEYGALLANDILKNYDISIKDRITIVSAIANHDESTGGASDLISAALIIADKTDVRRNRVRKKPKASFDVHDRVNYAVTKTDLIINKEKKYITLDLEIDEKICTMYEYFEIFLGRMMMCRKAAELLGMTFKLVVNGNKAL
ncbi:MAG: HD domain-containing protein [Lachnospiraceae bacterium]|nr:HD domain-containing protein [Lachnospiraceae bacterium]